MYFAIAFLTISIVGALITARTLCGYNQIPVYIKILVFLLFWAMWSMPIILGGIRHNEWISISFYNKLALTGYFLFGTAFLFFALIILRDMIWAVAYGIAKLMGKASLSWSPMNVSALTKANLVTIIIGLLIAFYALFEGIKSPTVKEINIKTPLVDKEIKILQINDMHIESSKPVRWFAKVVELANAQDADLILMPGDIVDDRVENISEHLSVLQNLKSRYGVYISPGNHELYNGLMFIQNRLQKMGFKWLFGNGENVKGLPIFVAGIPDLPILRKKAGFDKILDKAKAENYKILLAHNPTMADAYLARGFDLQLSGHTHGGQIFPFHIPVWIANHYLAGLYEIGKGKLYISRGTGYWGPPMRLLASSDMTLIRLIPEK